MTNVFAFTSGLPALARAVMRRPRLCCLCAIPLMLIAGCESTDDNGRWDDDYYFNVSYDMARFGDKNWMTENLDVAVGNSWCYNDSAEYCEIYGRLYTWTAAKNACERLGGGWRLPTDREWDALIALAGGDLHAGISLKSDTLWVSGEGTNDLGFSALPGGLRYPGGAYVYNGHGAFWWSATDDAHDKAYARDMYYSYETVGSRLFDKSYAFSVRCVRDTL